MAQRSTSGRNRLQALKKCMRLECRSPEFAQVSTDPCVKINLFLHPFYNPLTSCNSASYTKWINYSRTLCYKNRKVLKSEEITLALKWKIIFAL